MSNKNKNQDLLCCMFENSTAGLFAINKVLERCDDENFKKELYEQRDNYKNFAKDSFLELHRRGIKEPRLSTSTKMMMGSKIKMNMKISDKPSHLANMMIRGTNMGVLALNKELNHAKGADKSCIDNAMKMLKAEEAYMNRLKTYL